MKEYKCWLSIRGEKFFDYGCITYDYLKELMRCKHVKRIRFYKRGIYTYFSYWYQNSWYEREHILLRIEGDFDEICKE